MPVLQIFPSEWITFFVFLFVILGFVALSGLLQKRSGISGESTRQFVHIGVGLLVITSPFLFKSGNPPAVLAIIFIILNAISLKTERMKGIHTIERFSYGTVFFPITFLILIIVYWKSDPAILLIGMLLMTLTDPIATIVGQRARKSISFRFWKDEKTLHGSLALFVSAFLLTSAGLYLFRRVDIFLIPPLKSILITGLVVAIIATLSESISNAGSDNLTLPLFSALMLDIMLRLNFSAQLTVFGWVLFSFLLAFTAFKLKALTSGGAAGAMLLGSIVFAIGGVFWVIPMATFFVLSSILSRIGKLRKTFLKGIIEKGSNRDLFQVYANGGISLIIAILYFFTSHDLFYLMFLGSLAAATADTWGTEIGILSKVQPRNILTFSAVPTGTSGGVTVLGTSGIFVGAGILTLTGLFPLNEPLVSLFAIIVISGILGAFIDSILGAAVQAQYRCPNCSKITEKTVHCGSYTTNLISGTRWIDNDVVNLACTTSGTLFVLLFYLLLS